MHNYLTNISNSIIFGDNGKIEHCIKIISLFPYIFCINSKTIAFIILLNGTFCHGSALLNCKLKNKFKKWDIICNIFLSIYVNLYTSWQPWTYYLSTISFVFWILNNKYLNKSPIIHICGVQWIMCIALFNFKEDLYLEYIFQILENKQIFLY